MSKIKLLYRNMLKLKLDRVHLNKTYVTIVGDIIQSDIDKCYETFSYLCSLNHAIEDFNDTINCKYVHVGAYRLFISKKEIAEVTVSNIIEEWLNIFSIIKAGSLFEFQMKCRYFFKFDEDDSFEIEEIPIDKNSKLLNLNKIEFMVAEGGLSEKNELDFRPFTEDFCKKYRGEDEFEIVLKIKFHFDDDSFFVAFTTITTIQKFKQRINKLFLERKQDIILSFSHIPVSKLDYEEIISIFTPKIFEREDRFFKYDVKGKNLTEIAIKLLPYLDIDNPIQYLSELIVENSEVYELDIEQARQELKKHLLTAEMPNT